MRCFTGSLKRFAYHPAKYLIGMKGFTPALQKNRVAAFHTKRSNLDQGIRTAFENHTNYTDRTYYPIEIQAFGDLCRNRGCTDRIRKKNKGVKTVTYLFQFVRSELQTMKKRRGKSFLFSKTEILLICGKDFIG